MAKKTTKTRKSNSNRKLSKNLWTLFTHFALGKIILFFFAISLIISINILITKNAFESFIFLTGSQILIVVIISWIIYLFKKNK